MIEYPREYLPLPLREGYAFQAVSPLVRTEMQSGRARQRRRFTSVPTMASVAWILNDVQAQLFEAWFEDALKSGSEWFDCPLKTPEGGIQNYAARFTDIYQGPALVGKSHWRFSAELELRERPILPPGWGDFPGFIAQQSIIDIALNREWPEFAFDYATYAEALADLENLATGDVITIRADETQGGQSSSYEAYVTPPSTLILDFANGAYYVYDKTSTLTLVTVWAQ